MPRGRRNAKGKNDAIIWQTSPPPLSRQSQAADYRGAVVGEKSPKGKLLKAAGINNGAHYIKLIFENPTGGKFTVEIDGYYNK